MFDQLFASDRVNLGSVYETIINQLTEDMREHENTHSESYQSILAVEITRLEEARDHVCKALALLEKIDSEEYNP